MRCCEDCCYFRRSASGSTICMLPPARDEAAMRGDALRWPNAINRCPKFEPTPVNDTPNGGNPS
jgi:hypothetical protein